MTGHLDRSHCELPELARRTVPAALDAAADAFGDSVALRDADGTSTYEELRVEAHRLAAGLSGLGVRAGDAVVTMLANHADHVRLWLALGLGGFVSVPVNTALRRQALHAILADSEATILVCDAEFLPAVREVLESLPAITRLVVRGESEAGRWERGSVTSWGSLASAAATEPAQVQPWDLHSLMYTSGSTGRPKGVLVTHAQTYTRATVVDQRTGPDRQVALVNLPLFHVAGQCRGVLGPLTQGIESVIRPRFSVSRFWEDVRRHRATTTLLMGTMASYLLSRDPSPSDRDHTLRLALMAPVTDRAGEFAARFGTQVVASYGSTEAGTVAAGPTTTPGSLGWLHPDFEARVVDEVENSVPPGHVGELLVRGRVPWTMTPGYRGQPEATADLYRNQWLHTGDLVSRTPAGELIFKGRSKEVIRRSGENVAPTDVEAAALQSPGVEDCVALGVPSPDGEDDIKLVAVLSPDHPLSAAVLFDDLRGRLPRFMLPRYIELVDSLPRTPTEKVDKPALRATAGPRIWESH